MRKREGEVGEDAPVAPSENSSRSYGRPSPGGGSGGSVVLRVRLLTSVSKAPSATS